MSSKKNAPPARRGRLPAAEREQRRDAVLDATEAVLLDQGFEQVTMLAIARRAEASKETLYSWFGNRDGLFAALIERGADRSAEAIRSALATDRPPRATLTGFAVGLLTLLTSPNSVAINHAAMRSPELASLLLSSGRHRVGPLVEEYLTELDRTEQLVVAAPAEAFELLYGLVVRDSQIRVLLGEPAPSPDAIEHRAAQAVDQFLTLLSQG